MDLGVTVQVNDRALIAHLEKLPDRLRQALRPRITELTNTLLAQVHAAEPVRTGQLVSLTRAFVDERDDYIRGRVRVLAKPGEAHNIAAAALEYGVNKVARGHLRPTHIAARRFLRGPAAGIRERALAEIKAAIAEALG